MATKLIADRMKLVVEYAAGAAVAAVLYHPRKIVELLNDQEKYKIGIDDRLLKKWNDLAQVYMSQKTIVL